ncbi:MAG: hypothetical protein KDA05_05525 [Phycisphaerales bacterium]|nr:hypothetical protein [Phycisphaerales bacterium]
MRAILIRIGADGTRGGGQWLAPADPDSGRFVYIPIPEGATAFRPGCERRFDELAEPLRAFLAEHGVADRYWRTRLEAKRGRPMHLDPDFEHLTYGDDGTARGRELATFDAGDLIVFYTAFRPIRPAPALVYAMTGLFVVERVQRAPDVTPDRYAQNAHTRKASIAPGDIVVRARPEGSGRCERCVPIGEKRGASNYYLRPDVEEAWGGLVKVDRSPRKSSWLNMSGVPPLLGDPDGFLRWWRGQGVGLVQRNFLP